MPSSNESLTCRIDWRPSRLLMAALGLLTALAMVSAWLSALSAWLAWPAMAACLAHGLRLIGRELARPAGMIHLTGEAGVAHLNFAGGAESWTQVRVNFRGPLASLTGRDATGRMRRCLWWPDTLPAPARRQLRLVAGRLPAPVSPTVLPVSA
jgi:toxin CptA